MNRRRSEHPRPHLFPFLALALATLMATTGGAMHAFYRNGQIQTERRIAEVRSRIDNHLDDIRWAEYHREGQINRYKLRVALRDLGTDLKPVHHGVIVTVVPGPRPEPAVASRY